jgi:hypothetical protein
VILETRPRRLAVDLDIAGAQLKRAVDQIDRPARQTCRQKRSEIECAIALNAACDDDLRKWFVDRQLQMRIRLVVLEFDVVARLVLFDERRFENQSLDFVISDDEFEVGNLANERIGFAVKRAGAKV